MKPHPSKFSRSVLVFILMIGMFGFMPIHSAQASTLTVVNVNDSGAGSLRQAIANASSGDTITFDSSLSGQTIILASTLVINKNLTIDGSMLASKISISGNNSVRVFRVEAGITTTLNNLIVVSGFRSTEDGSGVLNFGTLNINNSTFSGNNARHAGGIANAGILHITNSTISGNHASSPTNSLANGGGIVNYGTLTIANSILSDNHANQYGLGGGILNHGTLEIANSTFSGNGARQGGGLENNTGGMAYITQSTFSGNSAEFGGGIDNYETLEITNSTFSTNSSAAGGGGIRNAGLLTLLNSTFSDHSVGSTSIDNDGGGIYNAGTMSFANIILANSIGGKDCYNDDSAGIINTNTNNLIESNATSPNNCAVPSLSGDPSLGPLANNGGSTQTMALAAASPAIDAGDDAKCPTTDQRGMTRPQGSHCDIGAYEYATRTISGNAGVAGATLSYTDDIMKTVTADGSGNYSITLPYGWSGTITPSLNADAFCPASQSYTNLTTNKTWQHYAHAPCPNFGTIGKWTSSFDLSHGWTVSDFVRTIGDVNGDGLADVVGFGSNGVYVGLSNGTGFDVASKWVTAFDLAHGWTVNDFVRTVGDVSGDGKAELVGFGLDGVYVATSTGSSFNTPSKWTSSFDLSHGWTVQDFVRTVGDVDGDGKADLVGFGLDGVYVSLSTGSSFPAPTKWTSAFDLSHGWTVSQYVRMVGDVNGDGKADLVGFGLDGVYVATSTGSGFNAVSKWTGSFALANGWTVSDFVRLVGDVNGDGRADIVGFGLDGVYIGLSTGSAFSLPSRRTTSFDLSHGWTVSQYVRTVGDVNGGGKVDLVGFGLDGVYVALAQ